MIHHLWLIPSNLLCPIALKSAWEAFWGKVLTLDQLKKRGRCLANRCFGYEEEESIDHILIQCSKARVLWELLFSLFGVSWVLPYSVRDTLSGWSGFNMGKKRRKVWKAAPSCIFWAVWKERNRIAFDNEELSMNRLKNSFVCNLWMWSKPVVNEGPLSLLGFFYWLGARWGLVLYFCFFLCPRASLVYSLYAFGPVFGAPC